MSVQGSLEIIMYELHLGQLMNPDCTGGLLDGFVEKSRTLSAKVCHASRLSPNFSFRHLCCEEEMANSKNKIPGAVNNDPRFKQTKGTSWTLQVDLNLAIPMPQ